MRRLTLAVSRAGETTPGEGPRRSCRAPCALGPDDVAGDATLRVIPIRRSVVTYCTCPHEASSAKRARILAGRGYADVHPLYGGLEAWRRAGGALVPK